MRHFDFLRTIPWEPQFKWVVSTYATADFINKPHEDYPKYTVSTQRLLEEGKETVITASNVFLLRIHSAIFVDKSFAGRFRSVNVRVGLHHAPRYELVQKYMEELEQLYKEIGSVERLQEWYADFNTIHPFQDGNGRVSGVVLGVLSHRLQPEYGWLAPLQ